MFPCRQPDCGYPERTVWVRYQRPLSTGNFSAEPDQYLYQEYGLTARLHFAYISMWH